MHAVVDAVDSVTGWSASAGASVHGLNQHSQFIAGRLDASVLFHFNGSGGKVTKAVAFDVSDYDTLAIHLWSRNLWRSSFETKSDCRYKLTLAAGVEFYVRVFQGFNPEVIDLSGVDAITEITIECLSDVEDYLCVSYAVASASEWPLDLYAGLRSLLEWARDGMFPSGIKAGEATFVVNDEQVLIAGDRDYLWRGSVVEFNDGANVETHQIQDADVDGAKFGKLYDGQAMIYSMADADVLLQIPVEAYRLEEEAALPGVTIYGMDPRRELRGSGLDAQLHSFTDTGIAEEQEGKLYTWRVTINMASRSLELNAKMAAFVRYALAQSVVWVNGVGLTFEYDDAATEALPTEAFDVIPSIEYTVAVEVREATWRRTRPIAGARSLTVTASQSG